MHFGEAIKRALMEKRFEDAENLKLRRAEPVYEISEAISDEVRSRLEMLQTLLTTHYEELAVAEDIESCRICNQHMDVINKILHSPKL